MIFLNLIKGNISGRNKKYITHDNNFYERFIYTMRPLIFFVYPDPKGSEEPTKRIEELGAAKINLIPLGLG